MGSQFSTAEAHVLDAQGKLLASGRGTYFTAPPAREALDAYLHQSRRSHPPRPRSRQSRNHRSRRRAGPARIHLSAARRHGERRRARPDQARPRARRPRRAFSPPTARNIWRPISASCAPASSRCRSISGFRARPSISFCGMPAPSSCSATRCAVADVPSDIPIGAFRRRWPNDGSLASIAFSIPAPSRRSSRARANPRCSSTRRARPARPKGVVLSHQSHIWVVETRLAAGSRPSPLSHRRAALSHERAGARQARLRRPRHHRAAAAVHGARLYRGDRTLSLHLADRRAADDRHDAARAGCARDDRSFERRVRPHGFGAGQRTA